MLNKVMFISRADNMHIRPGIHGGADLMSLFTPVTHCSDDPVGGRLHVIEGWGGGAHHRVHQVGVLFDHIRKGVKITLQDGLAAAIKAIGSSI